MKYFPEVDFLDATFDLITNTYRRCRKSNNTPRYIHIFRQNIHLKFLEDNQHQLLELLSRNSSNKQIFVSVKPEYEEALKKLGYQASLEYIKPKVDNIENNTNKLQRK